MIKQLVCLCVLSTALAAHLVTLVEPECLISGYFSLKMHCPSGYYCTNANKCAVDERSCMKYYDVEHYKNTRWRPVCGDGTTFEAKQCKGDRCFCYDRKGKRIFGEAFASQASNMTCACSRKAAKHEEDGKRYYHVNAHCDAMGNFAQLQCNYYDDQCYCTDPETGRNQSPSVPVEQMAQLDCYNKEAVGDEYRRRCELCEQHAADMTDEIRIVDPRQACLYDGSYGPITIENGFVSCVWRDGTPTGYSVDLKHANLDDIDCNCAIDSKIYAANGIPLLRTCLENGNYDPVQRDDDDYYCVDRDGFRINDIQKEKLTAEDCSKIKH